MATDTDAKPTTVSGDLMLVRGLIAVWVIVLVLGFLTVNMPGALAARNAVAPERAVFTAVNASTLTGFTQGFARPGEFSVTVQLVFFAQLCAGAVLSLLGGGTLIARLLRLPHATRDIAVASLAMMILATVLGISSLGRGESVLQAAARGLGALAGAGETIAPLLASDDFILQSIFLPLGLIGSVGAVVIVDMWRTIFSRQRMSGHVLRVLAMAAIGYLVGMVLLTPLVGEFSNANLLLTNDFVTAAIGLGNASSTLSQLPRGAEWVLAAVALLGVGTLGTQGAIAFAWTQTLPERLLAKVLKWIAAELLIVLVALVLLLQTEPALATDRALVLVVNAILNVGLSHGAVSITGPGLLILSALMLIGRLLPLWAVMGWISDREPQGLGVEAV